MKMKTILKVVAQTTTQQVKRQDGTQTQKCTLVLQEMGGKYENSFATTLLGNLASCVFYPGELVYASLRFQHREYNGQYYMDCTVQDITKLHTSNAF